MFKSSRQRNKSKTQKLNFKNDMLYYTLDKIKLLSSALIFMVKLRGIIRPLLPPAGRLRD